MNGDGIIWSEHKIKGTNFSFKYDIKPGCIVTEMMGIHLRFENFQKAEDFYRQYYEAIHYYTDYNPPLVEMGIDSE